MTSFYCSTSLRGGAGGFKGVRTRDARRGNETKSLEIEEKVEE
jgi:hypothetical protein